MDELYDGPILIGWLHPEPRNTVDCPMIIVADKYAADRPAAARYFGRAEPVVSDPD